LFTGPLSVTLQAQQPVVDAYQVRVVTKGGNRARGILDEVTDRHLYIGRAHRRGEQILLSDIRKVVIRRAGRKGELITGALIGGLAVGYLSNESLQKNQPRSPVWYGLTLAFATAGGAAGGLVLGSAISNLTSRVIRPLDPANPERSLFRQLEPFSVIYQQDVLNRLPQNAK